jgi:hypothetical protein
MSLLKSLNPCELVPVVFSRSSRARRRNLRSLSVSPNNRIGWPLVRRRRIHSSFEILNVSDVEGSGVPLVEGDARRCREALRAVSA